MAKKTASDPKNVEREVAIQRAVRPLGAGFRVEVNGSHAVISGIVGDYETKRRIYSLVQDTAGIEKVTNNIRVMPGTD